MNTGVVELVNRGKEDAEYSFIPLVGADSKQSKLSIIYANGYIHYHNYSDLHPWLLSPDGNRLLLTASYTPPIIFTGRNLLQLTKSIEDHKLTSLPVYRRGYHKPITDTRKPIITAAYFNVTDKATGKSSLREALPDIPDIPDMDIAEVQ